MSQVVRPFRGVPAAERRAARRAQLMEAILDVIHRDGLAGLKVAAVCQQAGLTERYFYESFANRDEALVQTVTVFGREMYVRLVETLSVAPISLPERSQIIASVIIDTLLDDPRKARAYVEAIGAEALRELRLATTRTYARLLAETIVLVYDLDPETDLRRLEVPTTVLIAGSGEMVAHWLAGDIDATREELVDQCAMMSVAIAERLCADRSRLRPPGGEHRAVTHPDRPSDEVQV